MKLIICQHPQVATTSMPRLAAGLQPTIVTAKMELGYIHTIAADSGGNHGNLFARVLFQKIF
jgi:hypothetical protein